MTIPTGIEIRRRGPAAVLALTGVDARGMFNTKTLQELKEAIEELPRDESVRVIVITGVGDQFCTSGNIGNEPDARAVFAGAFKDLVVAMAQCKTLVALKKRLAEAMENVQSSHPHSGDG